MADPRSTEDATNIHGLFGAVIVEAPEAKWFDPETGEELRSGLMADIYQPGKPAFREYSVFFHDELEILNKDGEPPVDPHTGLPSMTTAISYRSEPMRNRMPHSHDPADSAEDVSMSSWVYGDPAPPILLFLLILTNKHLRRFAINNGMIPTVNAMPAESHLSAGSIASGCGICVLCVKYRIARYTKHTTPIIFKHKSDLKKILLSFINVPPFL